MFCIINRFLLLSFLLVFISTGCSDDENILLSGLYFGEEGEGIVLYDFDVVWDYSLNGSTANSNNGIINRGEQIYLTVRLRNTSPNRIENVSARIRTFTSDIIILSNDFVYFGDVESNNTIESHEHYLTSNGQFYSYYSFVFQVDNSLPENQGVTFLLDINVYDNLHNLVQFSPEIR